MFRIDHLILGSSNLARGVALFQERTGVQAKFGGKHPLVGTENSLASLGTDLYLEVIAPQPGARVEGRWSVLMGLDGLAPIGWAVYTDDLDAAAATLRAAGFRTGAPAPGSRVQPDGAMLQWRTAEIVEPQVSLAPFLIEWSPASRHPSQFNPQGCAFRSLELQGPTPEPLRKLVQAMGLDVTVKQGPARAMILDLNCPAGDIRFSSDAPPDGSASVVFK